MLNFAHFRVLRSNLAKSLTTGCLFWGGQWSKFWGGQNIPWPTHSNFWGGHGPPGPPGSATSVVLLYFTDFFQILRFIIIDFLQIPITFVTIINWSSNRPAPSGFKSINICDCFSLKIF